jgi:3-hydroxyethyl bacteriochlorophyllide a dehydrogenase
MGEQALAIVFSKPRCAELRSYDRPEPLDDEILTQTLYSGVSMGTERWALMGLRPDVSFPGIPGYQNVGKVIAVGKKVRQLRCGDVVMLSGFSRLPQGLHHACGSSHASHLVAKAEHALKLDAKLNPAEAALLWVAGCSLEGVTLTGIRPGDRVLVAGQGLIGQMSAQIARSQGATVLAIEPDATRGKLAKRHSADKVVQPDALAAAVQKFAPGGVDVAIEATGQKALIDTLVQQLRPRGRFCFQGWYPDRVDFDYTQAHYREISMHFPCGWGGPKALKKTQKLLAHKQLAIKPLISHRLKPEQAPQLYQQMLDGGVPAMGIVIGW